MRRAAPLLLLSWTACRAHGPPSIDDEPEPDDTLRVEAPEPDAGFGAALVAAPTGDVWVGAPYGRSASVWRYAEGALSQALEGSGKLGAALALDADGPLASAPLDGEGRLSRVETGVTLDLGGSAGPLGTALAGGAAWAASTASGWVTAGGGAGESPGRPSALAWGGGALGVGMARGPVALKVGEVELARPAEGDEAGFALAAGDLDGDGEVEWLIGAPGADRVYLWSARTGRIERELQGDGGRFGAALSVADLDEDGQLDVLVGAPAFAASRAGAVYLFANGYLDAPTRRWIGHPGDELGAAVSLSEGTLAAGAPGGRGGLLLFQP